jgi:membrane fusion protein (multidrug efflux system)
MSFFIYKTYVASPAAEEKKVTVVRAEKVQTGAIQQQADFIGFIKAEHQTTLNAKVQGTLRIVATPGEPLKKGAPIAKIENHDVENNYKLLKETESLAQLQYDRWVALGKAGVVSKNAVDDKKSLLLEAQKRLSDAKSAAGELKFYAPFDGMVGLFKFRDGAQLQTGSTIVSFYDPSDLVVEFDIPLSIAEKIHDGTQTIVHGQPYPLSHIQKMLDSETHMCPAFVRIQCANCIIGASTTVSLVIADRENVIVIPFGAVFIREGKSCVYVEKDGKAILTPVTLGIRNKDRVEITQGLHTGDTVITEGHNLLYPEAPVSISEPEQTPELERKLEPEQKLDHEQKLEQAR